MQTDDKRVYLRRATWSDLDEEYFTWYGNDDHLLDAFTGSRRSFDKLSIVKDFIAGEESKRWFFYIIVDKASGERIGNVKLGPIDPVNKTSDLVALVGNRRFLGKGLATEAIQLGNELAFREYDIRKLQGGMYETNPASIKAYLKAGWVEEGRRKGHYWVDGRAVDRILVACFNPAYFGGNTDA